MDDPQKVRNILKYIEVKKKEVHKHPEENATDIKDSMFLLLGT